MAAFFFCLVSYASPMLNMILIGPLLGTLTGALLGPRVQKKKINFTDRQVVSQFEIRAC